MPIVGLAAFLDMTQLVPCNPMNAAAIKDTLDLHTFGGRQNTSIETKKLEPVPGRRIVAGGDLKAAGGLKSANGQAAGWRLGPGKVLHFPAGFEQSRNDSMAPHRPAGPPVATDADPAPSQSRSTGR